MLRLTTLTLMMKMKGRYEMALKDDLNKTMIDIREIKEDITLIKEDLNMHIRRTMLLEGKQDLFEQELKLFHDSAKNIETTAIIIQKLYKPVIFLILLGVLGISAPNLCDTFLKIISLF